MGLAGLVAVAAGLGGCCGLNDLEHGEAGGAQLGEVRGGQPEPSAAESLRADVHGTCSKIHAVVAVIEHVQMSIST